MMRKASCAVRLSLACALLVLVSGCDWTALGFGPANTNFNPFEPIEHLIRGATGDI